VAVKPGPLHVARSVAYDALLYGLMGVMGVLFLPLTLTRAGTYKAIWIYCTTMLWLLRPICGIRCEVRGPVPEGDVLIASKHQSFLDILILVNTLPQAKFVMKRELRYIPIFGLYATRIGSTPVARGQRSRAMKAMVAHVNKDQRLDGQLVIYPQGTRVAPGAYLPYKVGAGVLYERLGVTCVPAATNAGVFWGRRKWWRLPGTAVVEFLDPIPPGLPVKDFMERIEPVIETASDRLMREGGFEPGTRASGTHSPGSAA
jgi:1-acyl-sn-glycerol-3-phosphate acyltransferase